MVANVKKVIGMEEIQGFILTKLCESYMTSPRKLEILRTPMSNAAEFLEKLHVDIETLLLVTFLGFWYFFSIKDDAWGVFLVLLIKTKGEIYNKLIDF